MMEQHFEIAICGAGPVGMALAVLLVKRGVAPNCIALLDAKPLASAAADPRSIALSYGSRTLLEEIGAWPIPATAIHQIHVSRRGHLGRSMMDRSEHQLEALGYVARYGDVVTALAARVEAAGVTVIRPARVTGSNETYEGVVLTLDDGRSVPTQLVVQAEGGVFGEQDAKSLRRDYQQTAVIARVSASGAIAHRAYERFTDQGPLALLPQEGADCHQYALVWCVRPERAQELLALEDPAFLAQLEEAFGARLGRFTAASKRAAFPLGLNAVPQTAARTVAIGNAAQTLHPVAGQGLNLGLRDAAVLARLLARDMSPHALVEFAQAREADRSTTVQLTDAMARVFASEGPGQALLGLSLGVLDTLAPARLLLAELMMFGRR
ncbi:MAG: FAD-dependent monooxygenase [Pseudomonadota bacterium]